MVAFTWKIKLDSKNRIVIPLEARDSLKLADFVLIKLLDEKLVLTKSNKEKSRKISKNHWEVY